MLTILENIITTTVVIVNLLKISMMVVCLVTDSLAILDLDLSILGNKYINSDFKYHTDPGAGLRNR